MRSAAWLMLAWILMVSQVMAGEPTMHPVHGPKLIPVGDNLAQIDLPAGFLFLDPGDTIKLLKATHNVPDGHELGTIASTAKDADYYIFIEFEDAGYVTDDDAGKLDADKLLESIRSGMAEGNTERKNQGFEPLTIDGWAEPPSYQRPAHHVVWAVNISSPSGTSVNYNTRILGRRGILSLNLVTRPTSVEKDKKQVAMLLDKTTYVSGQRYEDYQAGHDKSAGYGLTGLILGTGAAAAAVKLGLFAKLGNLLLPILLAVKKFIIVIVAGLASGFRKLTARFSRKKQEVGVHSVGDRPDQS